MIVVVASIIHSFLYSLFSCIFTPGYPHHEEHFFVEADPVVKLWANALNEVRPEALLFNAEY